MWCYLRRCGAIYVDVVLSGMLQLLARQFISGGIILQSIVAISEEHLFDLTNDDHKSSEKSILKIKILQQK